MECPFYTALSPIHGIGLFSNQYFHFGAVLMKISNKDGIITPLGRWINHSNTPNIILHEEQDGYYAVASMPIYPGKEIVGNYKYTPDCLEKPNPNW